MKYINPKNDIAFKKIFANDKKKNILIGFLNAVLEKNIVDVTILNPFQAPKLKNLKDTTLDVKAKDKNGEEFIVEMQVQRQDFFYKRAMHYVSKSYSQQLKKGNQYDKLKPVYFIGIIDFVIFETKKSVSKHLILDVETNKNELKDFEFIFIELPKFKKKPEQLENTVDKWIYFIKEAQNFKGIPKEFENETELIDALEEINSFNLTEEQLAVYEYWEMEETKQRDIMQTAQRVAKEEGLQEGIEKGKIEGEKQKSIEIAKELLEDGMPLEKISKITKLSIDEIEKIKSEMNL